MKNKLAAWIVLTIIAVVAAVALAATNEVTKDIIQEANEAATREAWAQLLPGAEFPDAGQDEDAGEGGYVHAGVRDGETIGYVGMTAVQGYGGEIEVIVGTDTEGVITGISVGGANFKETAGLGAKAKEAAFTGQFINREAPLSVGEEIDAITAATITSNAVVRAVNAVVENISEVAGFAMQAQAAQAGQVGENRYAATTKGFNGPVYVEILLGDDNAIAEIIIGDDSFAETPGYGTKVRETAFSDQFIGKTPPLDEGDVDVVSGATISSRAVIDAVNTATLYATDPEAAAALGQDEAFELPDVPENALTEQASRKGFAGPVTAAITVDPDTHTLLRVEFGDDAWAETEGFGSKVKDEDFWQQFIGKTLPVGEDDIDLISGATITSQAAVEAVNKAYDKLFPADAGETEAPVSDAAEAQGNTASASSKGYEGPVAVTIAVDENNILTSLVVGDENFAETEGLGARVREAEFIDQFIGKTLPLGEDDIDLISGATISSEAVVGAVNKAYDKLQAQ